MALGCPLCDAPVTDWAAGPIHQITCSHCGRYRVADTLVREFSTCAEFWSPRRRSLAEAAKETSALGGVLDLSSNEDALKIAAEEALVNARESW